MQGGVRSCSLRLRFFADGLLWLSAAAAPRCGGATSAAVGATSAAQGPASGVKSDAEGLPLADLGLQPLFDRLADDGALAASLPAAGEGTRGPPGLWLRCSSLPDVVAAVLRYLSTRL